jgi:hypothetical protein
MSNDEYMGGYLLGSPGLNMQLLTLFKNDGTVIDLKLSRFCQGVWSAATTSTTKASNQLSLAFTFEYRQASTMIQVYSSYGSDLTYDKSNSLLRTPMRVRW